MRPCNLFLGHFYNSYNPYGGVWVPVTCSSNHFLTGARRDRLVNRFLAAPSAVTRRCPPHRARPTRVMTSSCTRTERAHLMSSSHLGLLLTTELAALYMFWDHQWVYGPPPRPRVRRERPPPGPPPIAAPGPVEAGAAEVRRRRPRPPGRRRPGPPGSRALLRMPRHTDTL
jgi:hypothetical protein